MGPSAQNSSSVHWCRRRVRFNKVPEKVPEKVWEAQQGSGEGSGEGLGGFGAEPGQVQQGSGEGLGGQIQKGSEEFRRRSGRLCQAQRVPEKVAEKVRRRFWESLVQGQVRFNGFRRRFRRRLREGSREVCFSSLCFLGFAACFRKICKNKMLRLLLLGIPPKLISIRKRFVLRPPHFQEPAFDTRNANLIR